MKSFLFRFYSLSAVVAAAVSQSKKAVSAVAAAVVGVGLLAVPFLLQANDEETNDAPEVGCLWVANFGSIGFKVKFDVTVPWGVLYPWDEVQLWQGGDEVDDGFPPVSLFSNHCDWLSIPGFDGGPPLPYPGYNQNNPAFEFTVKGLKYHSHDIDHDFTGMIPPFPSTGWIRFDVFEVDISLYVTVNSNGSLRSMSAYASDSDGDSYEIPVYYSAGGWGGSFETF